MGDHSQDRAAHQLLSPATPSQPIVALATASGRGAIGVVRVSGPDLKALARQLVSHDLSARHAHYGPFQDATGEAIDHGLAIYFPAPDSYTGEDVLELQGHGGPVVMQLLIQRVLQAGADRQLRLARPGEFTERAFLNGKLDLAQAEAVADLIDASSAQAARSASRSLAGEFSRVVNQLVSELIELRMLIEATLDFPEEEVDALARGDAQGRLGRLQQAVAGLLARASQGVLLRDGLRVVIAGPPNVGKSSLLNALAGAETAIVSPVAGTTRDKVTESILIDGVPINIVDTAGLRDTVDTVEQIGIERARAAIGQADVVLALNIAGQTASVAQDPAIALATGAGAHLLQVHNKVDQAGMGARAQAESQVWLSALTGEGIDLLRKQLLTLAGWQGAGEAQFIARERHLQALRDGQAHLLAADGAWRMGIELFAEELRLAQESLGQITGQFSADDLLGEIFSRFCIGK